MKILVVDDHPIVRSGLGRMFADDLDVELREAGSGREALALFRDYRPDLIILDLSMPGISGLEVIARLKIEDSAARILVLSMHQEVIFASRALQAGAAGFISKAAPPDQLRQAIEQVAGGHRYIEHPIAQELALTNIQKDDVPLQALSPREFAILRLLGDGSSLRQISDTIGVSYKTVANTCGQIKNKLGLTRTADLVRLAIREGISR